MATLSFETPADLIDRDRYPVDRLEDPRTRAVIDEARRSLAEKGVAILPGFARSETVAAISEEAARKKAAAHLEDVWGTPYLALPDETLPEGHPRRTSVHSLTWVIACDQIGKDSPLRALYDWDALKDFVAEVLQRESLFRMADPLGAMNLTVMEEGHVQGWHYDNADFVVSMAIQSSEAGGDFECAPFIRSPDQENYDAVARVLAGDASERVEIFPMTPGTLMIFEGRHSVHRVSPVRGARPRHVALLAYDTKPGVNSSELFKLVRYGRSEARPVE